MASQQLGRDPARAHDRECSDPRAKSDKDSIINAVEWIRAKSRRDAHLHAMTPSRLTGRREHKLATDLLRIARVGEFPHLEEALPDTKRGPCQGSKSAVRKQTLLEAEWRYGWRERGRHSRRSKSRRYCPCPFSDTRASHHRGHTSSLSSRAPHTPACSHPSRSRTDTRGDSGTVRSS